MPRFMRSIWSRPAANAAADESAGPVETPEMVEELERMREAEYVRSLQRRLADEARVANVDEQPRVTNIFSPDGTSEAK